MALTSLTAGIHYIDAAHMRDELAVIYIVREKDEVAIIETGTQHSIPHVLAALKTLGIEHRQVKYIIPTHIHLDHAGGASKMMELFDQARLIIHPRGARHMIDPSRLIEGSIAVYGEVAFQRDYGDIHPISENRIDIGADQSIFFLGERPFLFIDTPGHARHHFSIFDEKSLGIFSGDTFGLAYPPLKAHPSGLIPSSSPPQFDPEALTASIDLLVSYHPVSMYLTHYGEIDKPEARSVGLKQWIDDYVSLCERIQPVDDHAEEILTRELYKMTLTRLSNIKNLNEQKIMHILELDLKLSAKGLTHWWRAIHCG